MLNRFGTIRLLMKETDRMMEALVLVDLHQSNLLMVKGRLRRLRPYTSSRWLTCLDVISSMVDNVHWNTHVSGLREY